METCDTITGTWCGKCSLSFHRYWWQTFPAKGQKCPDVFFVPENGFYLGRGGFVSKRKEAPDEVRTFDTRDLIIFPGIGG
jgi:hypothetical protein